MFGRVPILFLLSRFMTLMWINFISIYHMPLKTKALSLAWGRLLMNILPKSFGYTKKFNPKQITQWWNHCNWASRVPKNHIGKGLHVLLEPCSCTLHYYVHICFLSIIASLQYTWVSLHCCVNLALAHLNPKINVNYIDVEHF